MEIESSYGGVSEYGVESSHGECVRVWGLNHHMADVSAHGRLVST